MACCHSTACLLLALLPAVSGIALRGDKGAPPFSETRDRLTAHPSPETLQFSSVKSNASSRVFTYDASGFTTKEEVANRPARIFFLFMAVDKVSNLGVWNNFFATAPPGQYRAMIHCKLPSCIESVKGSVFIPVPTVPSYYCTDLVSPMNQLLGHALNNDRGTQHPADKFVLVSDSTLPAKPFAQMYATLTTRRSSDFCAFPANEWADVPGIGGMEMMVKVHQWIVLERAHAMSSCILWAQGKDHDIMQKFGMNHNAYGWSNNSYGDSRNFGCLDEFWHMTALYGTLSHVHAAIDAVVNLQAFTNSPVRASAAAGWQGSCDTFVMWSKYLNAKGANPFLQLHNALDPASKPNPGNDFRPGWWDTISTFGIRAIRSSSFLFVRKFIDNPRLSDGPDFAATYSNTVFKV
jgi:hypothetical protein